MRHRLIAVLMIMGLIAAGCGSKPPKITPQPPDTCKDSDGPTPQTVQRAISAVPVAAPATTWVEITRGHARNCRLYWVQIIPSIANEATPQQLLFFDHNTPLGSPTPNAKPYTTVLPSKDDTVRVQYQWRKGNDAPCCPTGIGTVQYRIGSNGKLKALGPIPHQ